MDDEQKVPEDPGDSLKKVTDNSSSARQRTISFKRRPPPETVESIRVRSLVIGSFWVVVIFLGLPIWWWTTSIYRASLPLHEMLEWADGKVCVSGLIILKATDGILCRHANPLFHCRLPLTHRRYKRARRSICFERHSMPSMT